MFRRTAVLALALAACGDNVPFDRVLLFSRTIGYRHEAITPGVQTLQLLLPRERIAVDWTEDPGEFTPANLARYSAIIFFYTQGNDLLDDAGKAAIEAYVRAGGAWVGVHSAASSETEWPFYQELLVVPFAQHPAIQPATMNIEDRTHPATAALPPGPWQATDEWYNFGANPRGVDGVRILATIDESTYTGGTMGADHPMIWCHERFGGRVFFAQPGHVPTRWQEDAFLDVVEGGIRWAIKRE